MSEPVINLDEPIGKWVGRRRPPQPLDPTRSTKEESRRWRSAFGGLFPKGVYRFGTHEEANEWELQMLTRPRMSRS